MDIDTSNILWIIAPPWRGSLLMCSSFPVQSGYSQTETKFSTELTHPICISSLRKSHRLVVC